MDEKEEIRQKKNLKARLAKIERSNAANFYALDIETSGFEHNEPIQIGAVLFENGTPKK